MQTKTFSYDELTPLEQCIADRFLFAQLLQGKEAGEAKKPSKRIKH